MRHRLCKGAKAGWVVAAALLVSAAASQVPPAPEELAVRFIESRLLNTAGGIHTEFQDRLSVREEEGVGHEVLLQNTALLMLYAVGRGDRALFERQVEVIQRYFLVPSLGLLHWKLNRDMTPFLSRWGTHSDVPLDSLLAARALLLAAARWDEEPYRELARSIGQGLLTYNVGPDGTLRPYAAWRPDLSLSPAGLGDKVVLAYADLLTMDLLAELVAGWQPLIPIHLRLMLGGQTDLGLFHTDYDPVRGDYGDGDGDGDGNLLFMAMTALHLAEYGARRALPEALAAAKRFLRFLEATYGQKGKLLAKYDPETGRERVDWENIAAYGAVARLAFWLGRVGFGRQILTEQLLPRQRPEGALRGAFSFLPDNASALDTLQALLALRPYRQPIKGVWYLGWEKNDYLSPRVPEELRRLKEELGVTHVGLIVPLSQDDLESAAPGRDPKRTPPDEALRAAIRAAHELGLSVVLAPNLSVESGYWVGQLRPEDLPTWFRNWQGLLRHYAQLAEEAGVQVFLVGWEMETLRPFHARWQEAIEAVRAAFGGLLSYNTNWWPSRDEYRAVYEWEPWRALDLIGVTAFFELVRQDEPSVAELERAWRADPYGQDIVADLAGLSSRYDRCVLFGELGYESKTGTTRQPWNFLSLEPPNQDEQRDAFLAAFRVFSHKPWFAGYMITAEHVGLPTQVMGYTILGKKAAVEIRAHQLLPKTCPIGFGD